MIMDKTLPNYQFILKTVQHFLYILEAMNPSVVADGLALPKMTSRKWYIHGACAMTGDGIFESMKEMADMIKEHKKHKGY